MSRSAAFCGVRRWSATGSRTGALVMERHLLVAGTGATEVSGHHGDRLSSDSGDLRSGVSWRTSSSFQPERLNLRQHAEQRTAEEGAIDPVLGCPGPVNHQIPVMTNHRPGGKPGSVRSHMQGETT